MKFSIITATHSKENLPFLLELYQSITNQSYIDWEWILYLNNGIEMKDLPSSLQCDIKVIIEEAEDIGTNIGAIKNAAFHLGTGEVLVEVDHDDLLTANCLAELYEAFKDQNIGFVYSDSLVYQESGEFHPHSAAHGWTYKEFDWRGKKRIAMNHFPATSHSLSYIWYSPDHVRAWRTSVYKKLGGHDKTLSICDDHDLCIRTYLVTNMHFINKPLYVYRITGKNTWLERNKLIQSTTRVLFDKYIRLLAEKDAKDRGLLKLDLGGGLFPYKDYTTVDLRDSADIKADLNNGIPVPDNSVGVIHAHHILEHLTDQQHIMSEIHRVLAPGGWVFIEVPSTDGRGAFQDPTHVSYWNENNLLYYTNKDQAQFIDNTTIRFQEYKKTTYYPSKFMKDHDISVVCAVLVAIKPESPRYPGLLSI